MLDMLKDMDGKREIKGFARVGDLVAIELIN
jgi:hypothetical protein